MTIIVALGIIGCILFALSPLLLVLVFYIMFKDLEQAFALLFGGDTE